jgi:hypothetical protein
VDERTLAVAAACRARELPACLPACVDSARTIIADGCCCLNSGSPAAAAAASDGLTNWPRCCCCCCCCLTVILISTAGFTFERGPERKTRMCCLCKGCYAVSSATFVSISYFWSPFIVLYMAICARCTFARVYTLDIYVVCVAQCTAGRSLKRFRDIESLVSTVFPFVAAAAGPSSS